MVRLTEFSHGAGCGCKISPKDLKSILTSSQATVIDSNLFIGNQNNEDAAVYKITNDAYLLSTTDFFSPIVDDPFNFGAIACTNALSDIYAMGGKPILALGILGWPVKWLELEHAKAVLEGARSVCFKAQIVLAGGHSIDAPEPFFGAAVQGIVAIEDLKTNAGAQQGDLIYITKKIGIGIYATAQKRKVISDIELDESLNTMLELNSIGHTFGKLDYVTAMTDITGFGLAGHAIEMAKASNATFAIKKDLVPLMDSVKKFIELNIIPNGTETNYNSFESQIEAMSNYDKAVFFDPQTSGGLMVTVKPNSNNEFEKICIEHNRAFYLIGEVMPRENISLSLV
jgi:selenide, water dikinase